MPVLNILISAIIADLTLALEKELEDNWESAQSVCHWPTALPMPTHPTPEPIDFGVPADLTAEETAMLQEMESHHFDFWLCQNDW